MEFTRGRIYFTTEGDAKFCNCSELVHNLFNLTKDVLACETTNEQWKIFVQTKRKFLQSKRPKFSADFNWNNCALKYWPVLLKRVEEYYKHRGMKLSDLLVDLISVLYFKNCGEICCDLVNLNRKRLFSRNDQDSLRVLGAFRGKTNFMKLLMNYGYLSSLPENSPLLKQEMDKILLSFICSISNPGDTHFFENVVNLLKSSFCRSKEEEVYKMVFFAGLALRAVTCSFLKDYDGAKNYISCLRMYFSATSDPFLTIFEVRSVLFACLIVLDKLHLFDKYSQEFDKLMPECPTRREPRMLSHLARCQIRQNLKASNLPLTIAIHKLGIPSILRRFIVGDMHCISRESGRIRSHDGVTKAGLAELFLERPML